MSRYIRGDIIVGEAGDLLIKESDDILPFLDIESEREGEYLRVLRIPPVRQAFNWVGIILTLTQDNRLMIITSDYPQGVYLELDVPPIKRLYDLYPIFILDITDTLHPIDLEWIIHEQYKDIDTDLYYNPNFEEDEFKPLEFKFDAIENVKHVSYSRDIIPYKVTYRFWMLILTHDNRLIYGRSMYAFEERSFKEIELNYKIEKMAGMLLLTSDEILSIDPYHIRSNPIILPIIEVNRHVEDMIMMHTTLYILDSRGVIMKYQPEDDIITNPDGSQEIIREYHPDEGIILDTDFQAVRFLTNNNQSAVEDTGGNIYLLSNLEIIPYPIRLMDPNINPFRGLTKKPAMRTPSKAKLSAMKNH